MSAEDQPANSDRFPDRDVNEHDAHFHDRHALDVLIARAVSGDERAVTEVCARGVREPAVLEQFAMWQADELRLARVAHDLHGTADRVGVSRASLHEMQRGGLGWVAAAAIALVWFAQTSLVHRGRTGDAPSRTHIADVAGGFASSDEAFDAYVTKAREEGVMTEEVAPPILVRSRELGDGRGFEMIVVRQVYERRVAPKVVRFAPSGETGRMRPVVIRPRTDLVG